MNIQDSVSDMLTRIRNAMKARYRTVTFPASNQKTRILEVLKTSGYIKEFSLEKDEAEKAILTVVLKYRGNRPNIKQIKRISKPSLRVYKSYKNLEKVAGGIGIQVLSTSKGVMTDGEARLQKVGGEILCEIV